MCIQVLTHVSFPRPCSRRGKWRRPVPEHKKSFRSSINTYGRVNILYGKSILLSFFLFFLLRRVWDCFFLFFNRCSDPLGFAFSFLYIHHFYHFCCFFFFFLFPLNLLHLIFSPVLFRTSFHDLLLLLSRYSSPFTFIFPHKPWFYSY